MKFKENDKAWWTEGDCEVYFISYVDESRVIIDYPWKETEDGLLYNQGEVYISELKKIED